MKISCPRLNSSPPVPLPHIGPEQKESEPHYPQEPPIRVQCLPGASPNTTGGGEQEEWASGFHFPALLFFIAASRNSVYFLSVLEHDSLWDPRLNIQVCFNSSTCVFLFLKPSAFHFHGTVTRGTVYRGPSILPLLAGHGAPQKLKHKALDTAVMDTSANIPEKHPSPTPQVLITFNSTCYDSSLQQKECQLKTVR